jgi:hypothetical protein
VSAEGLRRRVTHRWSSLPAQHSRIFGSAICLKAKKREDGLELFVNKCPPRAYRGSRRRAVEPSAGTHSPAILKQTRATSGGDWGRLRGGRAPSAYPNSTGLSTAWLLRLLLGTGSRPQRQGLSPPRVPPPLQPAPPPPAPPPGPGLRLVSLGTEPRRPLRYGASTRTEVDKRYRGPQKTPPR